MTNLVAISGGIGSGKSVVSNILRNIGYDVYDCDSMAKKLMDSSDDIKRQLYENISKEVITASGEINRTLLGKIVFENPQKLAILNEIVHSSVRADILEWKNSCCQEIIFVETAILYQSKIDMMVDCIWEIQAPIETRIERVMLRNNISREDVIARINSQKNAIKSNTKATYYICNDGVSPVVPQVLALLKTF